jgi:hypothetical protein
VGGLDASRWVIRQRYPRDDTWRTFGRLGFVLSECLVIAEAAAAGGSWCDLRLHLQELLAEGQLYEAHQATRALFTRLKGQGKPGKARELALDIARELVTHA